MLSDHGYQAEQLHVQKVAVSVILLEVTDPFVKPIEK